MSGAGDVGREVESLRERLSRFRDAALRINESLELDEVLQGVLDSARELTGARYALISLGEENQVPTECLTSGLTPEQSEALLNPTPSQLEQFNFLFGIEETLRLDDVQGFLEEHGLAEFHAPFEESHAMAYLAVPIRHRGQRTGSIYVTKEGGFTVEDEETLAMFASQAALVISNARRYRGEQRARADLEGLVSTAPMSVLVFDAATGAVTSLNRDARRLLGELDLRVKSVHELVAAGTYRRADGRVISQQGPALERMLRSGEDRARRGDHRRVPRREKHRVDGQRDADPLSGRRRGVGGGGCAGHDGAGAGGAAAHRVLGHDRSRAPRAACRHQGVRDHSVAERVVA